MKGLLQHLYLISRRMAWGSTNCVLTEELEAEVRQHLHNQSFRNEKLSTVSLVDYPQ